jgi:hypothetical protein
VLQVHSDETGIPERVQSFYMLASVIGCACTFGAAALVVEPRAVVLEERAYRGRRLSSEPADGAPRATKATPSHAECDTWTLSRAVCSLRGWSLFGSELFIVSGSLPMIHGIMRLYGDVQPWASDSNLSAVSSMQAVGSLAGRLVCGAACDYRWRPVLISVALAQTLLVLTFPMHLGSWYTYAAACTAIGFFFGATTAIFPTVTGRLFGQAHFFPIYCFVYSAQGVGQMAFELFNKQVDLSGRVRPEVLCAAFALATSVSVVLGFVLSYCPDGRCRQLERPPSALV